MCICVSCACVCVARKTHTAELVCVSRASPTLVQSARPCSSLTHTHAHSLTPTLGHPPFTLLSLGIFSAGPRSKLECFVPVFFPYMAFRCRSVFCYLFGKTFPGPWGGDVWEPGGQEGNAKKRGEREGRTAVILPGQEDEGIAASALNFRNGASCCFLLTTLKFGFMALRRVLPRYKPTEHFQIQH